MVIAGPLWDFYVEVYDEMGVAKVVEDGAPVHRSKVAQSFRDTHAMDTLPHPAQSPDMNPIEHVWYLIKIGINKRAVKPRNEEELKRALLEEWEKIDIKIINNLIDSMPRRVEQLVEVRGGSTKY